MKKRALIVAGLGVVAAALASAVSYWVFSDPNLGTIIPSAIACSCLLFFFVRTKEEGHK